MLIKNKLEGSLSSCSLCVMEFLIKDNSSHIQLRTRQKEPQNLSYGDCM